jgi:hypothetical protein
VLGLQRLGVSGCGHYRGGGVEGRLLEGMGALREGKGWEDFLYGLYQPAGGRKSGVLAVEKKIP